MRWEGISLNTIQLTRRSVAVFSNDQHRQNPQPQNMSIRASGMGSHVFDEGQNMDAERRGSFALAAGAEVAARYLR